MTFPLPAFRHLRQGDWSGPPGDHVTLSYEDRFLRRKRLTTDAGHDLMVDLPALASLDAGDALETMDGQRIEVRAAIEPVLRITGPELARLAWHIGNRHAPCEIGTDHLLIRQDHVLEAMLLGLGAKVSHVLVPFRPEGGAYGHGRTLGHDHGHG